jgi:peptide/nickel transport system permease protein
VATQSTIDDSNILQQKVQQSIFLRAPKEIWKFVKKKPLGGVGLFILLLMCSMAIFAPIIADDPLQTNYNEMIAAPSMDHLFGTDDLGRDLWSRIIYGARISLYVGFLSVSFGCGIGFMIGLVCAFYGGAVDTSLQRVIDAMMAFPSLILALTIVATLGAGIDKVILAIGIVQIPRASRVVRAQALAIREMDYITAARAIGCGDIRIMVRHILPQVMAPWLIIASAGLGTAILTEASMSFLGLGVPAPDPAWGGMLSGRARDYYAVAPWMAIWPGVFIAMAVYGFNLFGDALRDILDPRLRGTQ